MNQQLAFFERPSSGSRVNPGCNGLERRVGVGGADRQDRDMAPAGIAAQHEVMILRTDVETAQVCEQFLSGEV